VLNRLINSDISMSPLQYSTALNHSCQNSSFAPWAITRMSSTMTTPIPSNVATIIFSPSSVVRLTLDYQFGPQQDVHNPAPWNTALQQSALSGNSHNKCGPFPQPGSNRNGTTTLIDNALTYRQSNARTFVFISPMQSFKHPKNFVELL
jgi:hypothetical protein